MSSITVSEKIKYDVTVDLQPKGVQCVVWRNQEDTDFIDVAVPYEQLIQQLVEYNEISGALTASGVEEVLAVRDSLYDVILRLNKLIEEAGLNGE